MRRIAAAGMLIFATFSSMAAAPDITIGLRDTGYMLGDLIEERIDVALPEGTRIDPDSLPLPGRAAPWLEVRHAILAPPRAGSQTLVVTYQIFAEAGFEWRESGCSMCLGMNPDILQPGERCASTSNRNFEGRQGRGGRTHLVSPMMAAAAAITGHFTDIRNWQFR